MYVALQKRSIRTTFYKKKYILRRCDLTETDSGKSARCRSIDYYMAGSKNCLCRILLFSRADFACFLKKCSGLHD